MDNLPLQVRIAHAVGLTGSAWMAGNIATYTLSIIPSILHKNPPPSNLSPQQKTRAFTHMYGYASRQNPIVGIMSTCSLFYIAYYTAQQQGKGNLAALYGTAGVICMGVVPWTHISMAATNVRLFEIAEIKEEDESGELEAEVQALFGQWMVYNAVRSLFPLVGCMIGWYAVLKK